MNAKTNATIAIDDSWWIIIDDSGSVVLEKRKRVQLVQCSSIKNALSAAM